MVLFTALKISSSLGGCEIRETNNRIHYVHKLLLDRPHDGKKSHPRPHLSLVKKRLFHSRYPREKVNTKTLPPKIMIPRNSRRLAPGSISICHAFPVVAMLWLNAVQVHSKTPCRKNHKKIPETALGKPPGISYCADVRFFLVSPCLPNSHWVYRYVLLCRLVNNMTALKVIL